MLDGFKSKTILFLIYYFICDRCAKKIFETEMDDVGAPLFPFSLVNVMNGMRVCDNSMSDAFMLD